MIAKTVVVEIGTSALLQNAGVPCATPIGGDDTLENHHGNHGKACPDASVGAVNAVSGFSISIHARVAFLNGAVTVERDLMDRDRKTTDPTDEIDGGVSPWPLTCEALRREIAISD
jgi:hypothetical protein